MAMSEREDVLLSDVVSILGDGLHGTPNFDDNGDYYFINGNNLSNGEIIIKSDTRKTTFEEYKKYKKNINERTILLSINGTLGNIAYYNGEKCILGKSACYLNVLDTVDKDFIRYIMTDQQFQNYIDIFAHGTTIKNVSLKTIREYPFLLPPLPEQKAIAEVLSSLDDKIDLLHRQNKTLEAMAEALFRQWFVNEASNDWEIGCLGDILSTIEAGCRPKGGIDQELQMGIPSVGAENINGIGVYDFSKTKYVTEQFFNSMKRGIVKNFDVLIYKDGAYVGRKGMFGNSFPFSKYAVNEHVFILRANERASQIFIYFMLQEGDIAQLNSNSAQPGLNQSAMRAFEIQIPPTDLVMKFDQTTKSWIEKIFENSKQIRTLEKLRDTLLPKLMSGEVRVEG